MDFLRLVVIMIFILVINYALGLIHNVKNKVENIGKALISFDLTECKPIFMEGLEAQKEKLVFVTRNQARQDFEFVSWDENKLQLSLEASLVEDSLVLDGQKFALGAIVRIAYKEDISKRCDLPVLELKQLLEIEKAGL